MLRGVKCRADGGARRGGCGLAVWGAGPARGGAIETVTTTADGDDGSCTAQVCTLRDAIKYSSAGDTVVVPAGTYNLTMGELSVGHDLTVSGAGVSSVTISGGNASRVLEVAASSAVTLSGVTITAGSGVGTGPNDPVPGGEGGAVADKDGWFGTGDVATIDRDGYVQLTDRLKDVIKSGGEWISSIEIENLVVSHPEVFEAAVIAISHPVWQERPLLLVQPKPGCSPSKQSILDFL